MIYKSESSTSIYVLTHWVAWEVSAHCTLKDDASPQSKIYMCCFLYFVVNGGFSNVWPVCCMRSAARMSGRYKGPLLSPRKSMPGCGAAWSEEQVFVHLTTSKPLKGLSSNHKIIFVRLSCENNAHIYSSKAGQQEAHQLILHSRALEK